MNYKTVCTLLLITLTLVNTACTPLIVAGAATGAAVLVDRRTTGTLIEDQAIELKAFKALNDHDDIIEHSNVSVTSYNERVLLTGQTETAALKRKIENIIKDIPKVKTIYNEVKVAKINEPKSSAYDTWLTTKIKAKITADLRVNPLDVKVTTDNKTVYLMGLVDPSEAEIATDIARNASGVTKVVRLFEYIDLKSYQDEVQQSQLANNDAQYTEY